MNDGLKDKHRDAILEVLGNHPRIERTVLFGSRAMGTFTPTSDVDVALYGDLSLKDQARIAEELDELTIPYKVDLVRMKTVTSPELLEHIKEHGVGWEEAANKTGLEWRDAALGDFVALQRGYDLTESQRRVGSVPVMGSAGQNGFHDTAIAKGPGIVIGRSGASFGQVHYSAEDFWPHNTALYVTDFKGNDQRFAFYFLKSIDFSGYNSGSAQPSLNRNFIYSIPVRIPPLPEQKTIAAVLGGLDDKIELNRRMNASLEAMARALFQSWFVDFDPVRAKLDGRQPPNLDPATAALFPDSFQDSELGHIPNGWKVQPFSDHITADRGLSYKGAGLRDDGSGLAMHNLNSIFEGGGYKHEGIKYYDGDYRDKHLVEPGDMIVTNTEQGFEHLLIGHAAIVPARFGPRGIFSHHIYRVRFKPSSVLTPHYLVQLFNNRRWHYWISGFSNGTTINMLPKDALEMPFLVVPPAALVEVFTRLAQSIHDQIEENITQSRTLATLRDTLLPKLLSGELSLKERPVPQL